MAGLLLLAVSGCTSMQHAAGTGDVQTVIKGLSAGKDVNMVDAAGRPLLAIAAERGQLGIIRELVSRGADLEKKDSRGMTPLFIAAGYNQLPAVQELVVAGANIESRNTELEFTPLMPAAESGYNAVVEYLLSRGADAAARSSDGQTALSRLARVNARTSQSNNPVTAQLLIANLRARLSKKAFADYVDHPDVTGMTPLHRAAGSNNTEIITFLLQNGANANAVARVPGGAEHMATAPEVSAFAQPTAAPGMLSALLPKLQQTLNAAGLVKRETAAESVPDQAAMAAVIGNWTPLHSATRHCQQAEASVAALLAGGANPVARTTNGRTTLQILADCADADAGAVVKLVIDKARSKSSTADFRKFVNEADADTGRSPLLSAVIRNQPETTRLLLAAGASPNSTSKDGQAPLHVALEARSHDVARHLLAAGANPDQPNAMGLNPLYWMVDKGDVEAVKVLLEGGAKPNMAGEGGWMPLHRAIGGVAPAAPAVPGQPVPQPRANPELVQLLLGKGANPNALLANGNTPLHMALEHDDIEAVRLLLAGGAKPGIKKADGVLPLYSAVANNKPAVVKLLLEHGANPDEDASLYIAVQQNNLPMVQLLLNAKANPEKAFQSWTPLHKAAADGRSEAYRMLMAAGARDTVRNDDGKTPRDLAREREERIAAQREAERIAAQERREASERRAQMFMAGMTTLAGAYNEAVQEQAAQQASQRQMLANIQAQADAQRRQQEAAAAAQAAERRQQQAAQQATQREALANQLADGIAYRNAQMERTTDAATRNRLAADNAKAMQAAQQIGAYDQVNRQAIAATSANQSAARQQREAQAQQEAEAARRAAQERQQRLAQQQAEERQRQAEQAERERQRLIAEREAERQRAEEQRRFAAEQRKRDEAQAKQEYLDAHRRGIRLAAKQCESKEKPYWVGGIKPNVRLPEVIKHHAGCVAVKYEARCPGTPKGAGVKGMINYYAGTGSGCLGTEGKLARTMSCPADDVQVDVDDVISCT